LIAPVVTITPLPRLYHVRAFYIACYTIPTTHPSQPTYKFNELQKEENRNIGERRKKEGKHIVIIIIIYQ